MQAAATGGLGSPNKHFVSVRSQDGAEASGSPRRPPAATLRSLSGRLLCLDRGDALGGQRPMLCGLRTRGLQATSGHDPNPRPHLGEAYLRTYLVRTAGLEPALSERNRFSYHFGFRRRQSAFVAWTVPSPWRLGRRRRPSSLYTFPQSRAWLGIGLGLEPVSVPRL